ncbi:MarR family transcriptional regulator [Brenneria goodwinii]|nr:MarR family transcriptional regulator [Brenneria goodwinii]MCG8155173.1 MarR family transcriptional regulator [Brenneria goodwinii]MCG8159417.1 MarR family transcriptional regulator [Brenneria goodwinii]MCG8164414.1 MarR family transcriptional regulator [Brenneria goodwinii]MCG8169020.1 MarR family transcriptional regulator [Brenneria goodwinii]MCG8173276.1 MarR family transcriptional regulator [Brenneria goodwinii]
MTRKMTTQQRVAGYIRMKEGGNPAELTRCLNLTTREVSHAIDTLKKAGLIQSIGSCRKAKYYPAGKVEIAFGVYPAQAQLNKLLAEVRA